MQQIRKNSKPHFIKKTEKPYFVSILGLFAQKTQDHNFLNKYRALSFFMLDYCLTSSKKNFLQTIPEENFRINRQTNNRKHTEGISEDLHFVGLKNTCILNFESIILWH